MTFDNALTCFCDSLNSLGSPPPGLLRDRIPIQSGGDREAYGGLTVLVPIDNSDQLIAPFL